MHNDSDDQTLKPLSKITSVTAVAERDQFLKAMRCVACTVSVVTTNGHAGRHGATVSAFSSVSADPPTVLICLNQSSAIAKAVGENGVFRLNILPTDAIATSNRFAGLDDDRVTDRFEDIDHTQAVPLLAGATSFLCSVTESTKAGSHHIYIGVVNEVNAVEQTPLTYFDGRYHIVQKHPKTGN